MFNTAAKAVATVKSFAQKLTNSTPVVTPVSDQSIDDGAWYAQQEVNRGIENGALKTEDEIINAFFAATENYRNHYQI